MRVLLFVAVVVYCSRLNGQDSTIIIKAGKSFSESVAITELYQYPQFVNGKVFFKSGDSGIAKLNYDKFLDEMQFIGPKGDTLNIGYPGTIKFIRINSDVFYYDKGWMRLVKESNGIKLAAKQTLKISGKDKTGAYGMSNPTSAIDNYGVLMDQRGIYRLTPQEDVSLTRKTLYYFGDRYNEFVLATKKSLLQQFSEQSKTLNTYIKDNNINFNNRDDLEKLLQFLVSL